MSGSVVWTRHCPPCWPLWAQNWATTKGSLTKRLVGLNQGFAVEPVVQGKVFVRRGPAMPADCDDAGLMRQRLVRLYVNKAPVVLAQTLVRIDGNVNDWRFWRGLGNRSLGSVLFSDPEVKRGSLYFARLPFEQAWVQQLLGHEALARMNELGPGKIWYARCARFTRKPERTPLWVMEVFLPQLENYI